MQDTDRVLNAIDLQWCKGFNISMRRTHILELFSFTSLLDMDTRSWFLVVSITSIYVIFTYLCDFAHQSDVSAYSFGLNPSQQSTTMQLLAHSLTNGIREGTGKVEVKLVSWDKDSLTGETKAVHVRKAKYGIHPPHLMGKLLPGRQGSIICKSVRVTWEDNEIPVNAPPFFLPPALYDE